MAGEITVFEIPEQEITSNKSQKELEFEQIGQKTKIKKSHVESFYEMSEFNESQQKPKSTLVSIMLKWLLQYCMPIITDREEKYSISLQNETSMYGINNGKFVMIPSAHQFNIIGIKIPILFSIFSVSSLKLLF